MKKYKALTAGLILLLIMTAFSACRGGKDVIEPVSWSEEGQDIAVSEHYSYKLPLEAVKEETDPESGFVNDQKYSFVDDRGKNCVARSYITANEMGDLAVVMKLRLGRSLDLLEGSYEKQEFDFGDAVVGIYDVEDGEGGTSRVYHYIWRDEDSAICTLEISSSDYATDSSKDQKNFIKTAKGLVNTVHSAENNVSNAETLFPVGFVDISAHYYYHMPEGTTGVWRADYPEEENETWCTFDYEEKPYEVRSYVFGYDGGDLDSVVKDKLSAGGVVTFEYEDKLEGRYGEVLRLRYETGQGEKVIGYYWKESDTKICCLEVMPKEGGGSAPAEMIMNSVVKGPEGAVTDLVVPEPKDAADGQQGGDSAKNLNGGSGEGSDEPKEDPSDILQKP